MKFVNYVIRQAITSFTDIIKMYDWYERGTYYILVMERPQPVQDLFDYLNEHGPMSEPCARNIFRQVRSEDVHMYFYGYSLYHVFFVSTDVHSKCKNMCFIALNETMIASGDTLFQQHRNIFAISFRTCQQRSFLDLFVEFSTVLCCIPRRSQRISDSIVGEDRNHDEETRRWIRINDLLLDCP